MILLKIVCLVMLTASAVSKLYQVVSLFRHGARYPLHPYYDSNATRPLWGELTAVGMSQHQKLGQQLRKDYIQRKGFISPKWTEGEVIIHSTDINRTIQSARSQIYGLYPLGTGPQMDKVDSKYHIPPFSNKEDAEQKLYSLPEGYQAIPVMVNGSVLPLSCPRSNIQMQKNEQIQLQTYQEMNLTYYPFMKRMGQIFNFTTLNFTSMFNLFDSLVVDKYLGRPMPPSFTDADYANLRHLSDWSGYFRLTFNLSKALNTVIMQRVLQDFDDRVKNVQNKSLKWTFLSAHDTNIFALNNDLNISSSQCIEELYRKGKTSALNCQLGPDFASSLIFELHSDDEKEFHVQIRYNGNYVYLCGGKSVICNYNVWKSKVKSIIIPYAREVCYGNQAESSQDRVQDFAEMNMI